MRMLTKAQGMVAIKKPTVNENGTTLWSTLQALLRRPCMTTYTSSGVAFDRARRLTMMTQWRCSTC